mgnify:CR=1 FL=1
MSVKAAPMIKFGYVMLALNMIGAAYCWLSKDEDMHDRTLLFMMGSCLWIVMILIWYKVKGDQDEQDEHK